MLAVDGVGTFTAVGLDAPQTMGSLRTGVTFPDEVQVFTPDGEPLVAMPSPLPLEGALGLDRLVAMGAAALAECARGHEREPTPLLLCAPEVDVVGLAGGELPRRLERQAGVALDAARGGSFAGGHAALGPALAHARRLLAAGEARACYVAAVDSLLDVRRLTRLIADDRVQHRGDPADGLVPGEAAVVLRVTARPSAATLAVVRGVGVAEEPRPFSSGRPTVGEGLAAAARAALGDAGAAMADVRTIASDVAGERWFFQELAFAVTRLRPRGVVERLTPATVVGEVGAAAPLLALAYLAFRRRAGGGPAGAELVTCSSDGAARAAVLLTGR